MKTELMKNKVLLGMSGGVDSTVAALLLKEKGYDVVGYYFDITGCNEKGIAEAQAVADQTGIQLITEDVKDLFDSVVVDNFCKEYQAGRTPNPCIVCNPGVKFRRLLDKANEIGAEFIATGHYARITSITSAESDGEQYGELKKYYVTQASNIKKDQSYMLYRLTQEFLGRIIFPLGEFEDKEQTRDLARSMNLSNAEKKDSQEICFVPDDDYVAFLEERGCKSVPGEYVDKEGNFLGKHKGIVHYTIGQRKGLGIALGKPAFVTNINPENNQIVLGDNEDLFSKDVFSMDNVFSEETAEAGNADLSKYDGMHVNAKIRYAAQPAPAVLHILPDGTVHTEFETPQRASTPGQSVVWYVDSRVIGGGFITNN